MEKPKDDKNLPKLNQSLAEFNSVIEGLIKPSEMSQEAVEEIRTALVDYGELLLAAMAAAGALDAIYQWMDRVLKAGGTTCIAGIAECHAMLSSLQKNESRTIKLVVDPLLRAMKR